MRGRGRTLEGRPCSPPSVVDPAETVLSEPGQGPRRPQLIPGMPGAASNPTAPGDTHWREGFQVVTARHSGAVLGNLSQTSELLGETASTLRRSEGALTGFK